MLPAIGIMLSLLTARPQAAPGKDLSVKPGEIVIDPPTLINLGFEWPITGDDNRNARVDVSFRKKGTTEWRKAMPLMRLQGEHVYQGVPPWANTSSMSWCPTCLPAASSTLNQARNTRRALFSPILMGSLETPHAW